MDEASKVNRKNCVSSNVEYARSNAQCSRKDCRRRGSNPHDRARLVKWTNAFKHRTLNAQLKRFPADGLEPTRSCDHWILSPARLPVPPRRRRESESTKSSSQLKRFR